MQRVVRSVVKQENKQVLPPLLTAPRPEPYPRAPGAQRGIENTYDACRSLLDRTEHLCALS